MSRYIRTRRPSAPLLHAWLALAFYSLLSIGGGAFGAWMNDKETMLLLGLVPLLGIVATMILVDARAYAYPYAYRMVSSFKRAS